jgi:hypothetical protein
MKIYRLSIVTRYKDTDTLICDVDYEKDFRKLSSLKLYRDKLLKKNYDYVNMDITVYDYDHGDYDYAGTLDSKTLKDKGF